MDGFKIFCEALIVYHGTNEPLSSWSHDKHVSGYYPGFYTTVDLERAGGFGKHVYKFDVSNFKFHSLKDGKDADELKKVAKQAGYWISGGSGHGESKYLKDQGYDGINRGNEYIIFDPSRLSLT